MFTSTYSLEMDNALEYHRVIRIWLVAVHSILHKWGYWK